MRSIIGFFVFLVFEEEIDGLLGVIVVFGLEGRIFYIFLDMKEYLY